MLLGCVVNSFERGHRALFRRNRALLVDIEALLREHNILLASPECRSLGFSLGSLVCCTSVEFALLGGHGLFCEEIGLFQDK